MYEPATTRTMRCADRVESRGWWQDHGGCWWLVDACAGHAGQLAQSTPPARRVGWRLRVAGAGRVSGGTRTSRRSRVVSISSEITALIVVSNTSGNEVSIRAIIRVGINDSVDKSVAGTASQYPARGSRAAPPKAPFKDGSNFEDLVYRVCYSHCT